MATQQLTATFSFTCEEKQLKMLAQFHKQQKRVQSQNKFCYFGLFDGHDGDKASIYCSQQLHKNLLKQKSWKEKNYQKALRDAIFKTDKDFLQIAKSTLSNCGTTALVALFDQENSQMLVANVGDSRCVLCRNGSDYPLSQGEEGGGGGGGRTPLQFLSLLSLLLDSIHFHFDLI